MNTKVTIVDYGVGNLLSVRAAFEYCGAVCEVTDDPSVVEGAERLLLPGVGAFGDAMADMQVKGLAEPTHRFAATGRPLLGICVGMQMLMDSSEEFGNHKGLGLIPGPVLAIPPTTSDGTPHRLPHIGWDVLTASRPDSWTDTLLADTREGSWVYFVHSFTAFPSDPAHRLADCDYNGRSIAAVVRRDNVMGCQFHPERSGETGLNVIRRFLKI